MHAIIKLVIITAMIAAAWVLIWVYGAPPVKAQDQCVDVLEDRAKVEAGGYTWLGVFDLPVPSAPGSAAVFYSTGSVILVSPVVEGCVLPNMFPIGFPPASAPRVEEQTGMPA